MGNGEGVDVKLLTIGMATCKDFDGVFFTLQSLTLHHDCSDVEFVVVDNAPKSCPDTRRAVESVGGTYEHWTQQTGTAGARNHLFSLGTAPYVLCLDCHVLLASGALQALREHYQRDPQSNDLLQGPLLYDHHLRDPHAMATHFAPRWGSDCMYGQWACDPRYAQAEPFDIPMQGLGLFSMRRAAWPGFNPEFRGFGGEEGYIHEKVRQRGGRTLCLPALKWVHRFARPGGVPYPCTLEDKLRNYILGWSELGLPLDEVYAAFAKHPNVVAKVRAEMQSCDKVQNDASNAAS